MTHTMALNNAFHMYEKARKFMPLADFSNETREVNSLVDFADEFDVAVLDSFGVLNVGETTIPGAVETVHALREAGKHIIVLTNGATLDQAGAVAKVEGFGFDIKSADVISSRSALKTGLREFDDAMLWGILGPVQANCESLGVKFVLLDDNPETYARVDGFILLSTHDWSPARHVFLEAELKAKSRPVLVGNPDIVAPRETNMSTEPGYVAWLLHEACGVEPVNFGKPHKHVFEQAKKRIEDVLGSVDLSRTLMVGDSLHTDILGGAAAGFKTVLTTQDGFLKGANPHDYFEKSGIRPDFMLPRI